MKSVFLCVWARERRSVGGDRKDKLPQKQPTVSVQSEFISVQRERRVCVICHTHMLIHTHTLLMSCREYEAFEL